ncbi:hypothetical protein ACQ4PT_062593 [Festuca glaucescens]
MAAVCGTHGQVPVQGQVSSFSTNPTQVKGSKDLNCSEESDGDDQGDILRWKNSLKRDFTINSLFFNPFNNRVYDYVNGVMDLRKNKAAYLSDQMKGRSSDRDLMLMKLLANLDKFFSADWPCHSSLWLGLLAFHTALVNSPQDAQVIKAFAALMHFGTWDSAVEFLKQDVGAPAIFVPEALGPSQAKLDDNLMKQISQLASLVNSSADTFTSLDTLKQSLARYSKASQFSGVVFVSAKERSRVLGIFKGLDSDLTSYVETGGMHGIDYRLLDYGDTREVRFVLGKVISGRITACIHR